MQVHPDDSVARRLGLDSGKTECWYFLKSSSSARIYHGLRAGSDPRAFFGRMAADPEPEEVHSLLRSVDVREGDIAFIPAGTIHAVGGGTLILEVQQDSDTTFRIYDWGRPRELHLEHAMMAVQAASGTVQAETAQSRNSNAEDNFSTGDREGVLLSCPFFSLSRFHLAGGSRLPVPEGLFSFALVLDGTGRLEAGGYRHSLIPGDAFFLPAGCPAVSVRTRKKATIVLAHQGRAEDDGR